MILRMAKSAITVSLFLLFAGTAIGQNASDDKKAAQAKTEAAVAEAQAQVAKVKADSEARKNQPVNSYRLEFSVNELEEGKAINTRRYSTNLSAAPEFGNGEIKIGTRVPVELKQGEMQYLDIGTRIECRLQDQTSKPSLGNDVELSAQAELSSFAQPDQATQTFHPIVRQLQIRASGVVTPGKPTVMGTVDDPNSRRQFQLEVTVTKLR
jgi:hypothetical protein